MEHFKSLTTLEERKIHTSTAMKKYNGRIPVYVYKHNKSHLGDVPKHKFLVPTDITVGQFIYIIRKQMSLTSEQGIFIFIDNLLPPTSALMSQMYKDHCDEDGFLYIAVSHENVFG